MSIITVAYMRVLREPVQRYSKNITMVLPILMAKIEKEKMPPKVFKYIGAININFYCIIFKQIRKILISSGHYAMRLFAARIILLTIRLWLIKNCSFFIAQTKVIFRIMKFTIAY